MPSDPSEDWRPTAEVAALRLRARLLAHLRSTLSASGALEVETPMLSQAGNTDPNIESFALQFDGPAAAGERRRWLRTSPEFALKRLLASGVGDCFELGRVFRNGEAGGRHNPEFTLLEWYRIGWDHRRLMAEISELVQSSLALVQRRARVVEISYRDLFASRLGLDPLTASIEALAAPLKAFRIQGDGLQRDDWLDLLLTHLITPDFPPDQLLLLYDYPASQCALAKISGTGADAVAQRFEVYLGPLELANGYHELTDAGEQGERFARDLLVRQQRGASQPAVDRRLLAAIGHKLPDCAGVALGVDRLLAAMLGSSELSGVLAFPFARA